MKVARLVATESPWAARPTQARRLTWAMLTALLLIGCTDNASEAPPPPPVAVIPEDAKGHYCGMFLFEHKGPKAQVLLRGKDMPVWFTTIREVFAYTRSPEEPKAVGAIYVQDMARASEDGSFPPDAWIPAQEAQYLIRSRYVGGMGRYDALPFSSEEAALPYQRSFGGTLVRFQDMPEDYIFGLGGPEEMVDPPRAGAPNSERRQPEPIRE